MSSAVGDPERLAFTTRPIEDPGDLLGRMPDPGGVAWVREHEGIVGWGELLKMDLGAGDRFAAARRHFAELMAEAHVDDPVGLPGTGPIGFCSLTFDARSTGSVLVVPRVVVGRRGGRAWMTTVDAGADAVLPGPARALPRPGRVRYAGASQDELVWLETVAAAAQGITDGQLDKVVLARDVHVWSQELLDPRILARRLAQRFPSCFTFVVDGFIGATPELLVRRTGELVESLVLAGSAPRGVGAAEDAALGQALLASAKDRAEHRPAIDSVLDRLGPLCRQVEADPGPTLLRLDNIQHLATRVRGHLDGPATVLDLAEALHPTAAVCGSPRSEALRWIREREGLDRGRYAGPVGWIDRHGDGELGIALRCAEISGARARLFAGAGIVAASRPESELEETRLKLRAMQSAFED